MCGIIGQVNYNHPIQQSLFNEMRDTLKHRGPDGSSSVFLQQMKIALGHRRLSIIDLSDNGKQPMSNEDATIWVTFNGEIYNYLELRNTLEAKGHRFRSRSDTEVLVHGYEEWGRELPTRLKGMFAFGIWDDIKQELFLARDRFGVKPLYYYTCEGQFIFGSELKAIVANPDVPRNLDIQAVSDFFVYRSIPSPRSIWQQIYKLPPAHHLHLRANGAFEIQKYWEINTAENQIPLADAVERVEELLVKSVQEHLLSDVPVGLLLSGGLDSSTLAWLLSRAGREVDSFTIGFENWELSEHRAARLAASHFGANYNKQFVGADIFGKLAKLVYHFDEPLGGTSFLPTFELARLASDKVKVVLSGDGGDEVFAGYKWHQSYFEPWYLHLRASIRNRVAGQNNLLGHYRRAMNWTGWSYQELSELYGPDLKDENPVTDFFSHLNPLGEKRVKSLQLLDYHFFLPEVNLHKIDRASMAHGLEVRVPFLDHQLTEYVMQLSEQIYFNKKKNKKLLFELIKNHFPKPLLDKPKKGFGMSVNHFFKLNHIPTDWRDSGIFIDRLINPEYVQTLVDRGANEKLWAVIIFMAWYEKWKK